jgi:hypothetical protein
MIGSLSETVLRFAELAKARDLAERQRVTSIGGLKDLEYVRLMST